MIDGALDFMKMHGLGNDFVVLDWRERGMFSAETLPPALARAMSDRHFGVGCDQIALILPSDTADARLVFLNSDGSASATCGNATRCIAHWIMAQSGRNELAFETGVRRVCAENQGGRTRVNLGHPSLTWQDVPLKEAMDTLTLPIEGAPSALSMGNPHCVFFVSDVGAVDLAAAGAAMEHHPLFPERTNVEFVEVLAPDRLRLRIWERGAGVTLSSGSCSSAAAVAAARRGMSARAVQVVVDGGVLGIDWRDDGVWLEGPVAHVFSGRFEEAWLAEVLR